MEKTVEIDGKKVRFKSSGATPIHYRAQFNRDFFADILKLRTLQNFDESSETLDGMDFEVLYRVLWTLAKTADKETPDMLSWLESFDNFPLFEVVSDVMEIIAASIHTKKNFPVKNKGRKS